MSALVATGVLAGIVLFVARQDVGAATPRNPRVVAWVDFDSAPVRRGVAKFREYLNAQHFDAPGEIELRLFAADVQNPVLRKKVLSEVLAAKPALIVASSVDVAKSLLALDSAIPIYFVIQSDPVMEGLVPSLVSTGALTGYTFCVPLDGKIMELIRRVFPEVTSVGVVASDYWLEGSNMSRDFFAQAKALGLNLEIFNIHSRNDIEPMLGGDRARGVQVWYIPYADVPFNYGAEIAEVLSRSPTPTVYARRKFLKLGGLISVQAVDDSAMETWAKSMANILNGVPVGSIPVMRPKEIEIAVNSAATSRLDRLTRERLAREATVFE